MARRRSGSRARLRELHPRSSHPRLRAGRRGCRHDGGLRRLRRSGPRALPVRVSAWSQEELAERLRGPGIYLHTGPFLSHIRTAVPAVAEGIAVEGMRLVKDWLPKAVKDGKDLAARAHMLAAASMGATAFQKRSEEHPSELQSLMRNSYA